MQVLPAISTECAAVQVYQLVSIQRAEQTLKSKEIRTVEVGSASSTADQCGIREPLLAASHPVPSAANENGTCKHK